MVDKKWYQEKSFIILAVVVGIILMYFSVNNTNNTSSIDNTNIVEFTKTGIQPKVSVEELSCHPSYSGCLNPNASDYDCDGGSGNGPYYTGRIRVIGPDVFGLDRDGDGWGCE